MQRIEPAACLVNSFADIISREIFFKPFFILKRIMELRERHSAGIVPYVYQFGRAAVYFSVLFKKDFIDKRFVQINFRDF